MNPLAIPKLLPLLNRFRNNHPKFFQFMMAAVHEVGEGTIVEVTVKTADGKNLCTNMKINAEDLDLVKQVQEVVKSK